MEQYDTWKQAGFAGGCLACGAGVNDVDVDCQGEQCQHCGELAVDGLLTVLLDLS